MGDEVGADKVSGSIIEGKAPMPAGTGKINHGQVKEPGPFVRGQLAETVMGGVQCLRAGTGCDLKEDDGRSRGENSDKPDRHENDTWCASSHEVSMENCESPANLQMQRGRGQATPLQVQRLRDTGVSTGVSTGVLTDMTRNRQDRARFPAGPRKRPFR